MKKKIIAVVSAAVMMFTTSAVFHAEGGVVDMLSGYEDGEIHLERTLTRAEFAKIFVDALLDEGAQNDIYIKFSDVPEDFWGKEYIEKAVGAQVISGFEDGTFRPEEKITYEQALTVICRYLSSRNYRVETSYDQYPQRFVAPAVDAGIADGVSAITGDEITRGDIVTLLDNLLAYIKERKESAADDAKYYEQLVNGVDGSAFAGSSVMVTECAAYAPAASMPVPMPDFDYSEFNTEEYVSNEENIFKNALISPLSTFSIDTDTASYSNMRRFILNNQQIPNGSIRTEELINYFDYDNPLPQNGEPFAVSAEVGECSWNSEHLLAKIAVQGAQMTQKQPSNLVFLLDTSGSMDSENKLPLVKKSLKMLLEELDGEDTVSIVTYASGTRVALESTPVSDKDKILETFDTLFAFGGTNGAGGINLAYEQAEKNLIKGNNRIILCTDGDFNIGASSTGDLEKLIEEKRDKGIFLTVLGFGMGNYKDNRMETLADKGNGTYAYIDSEREAKKVFVDEMPKTLYTIAKDVKIQTEFNPERVKEYRLIGYENRVMNNEDFDNDKKDAGELGCGATVTALYEIIPADGAAESDLKYQTTVTNGSEELMNVKIRYKEPDGDESKLLEVPVADEVSGNVSDNFKFASAVAQLGMILNDSQYKGTSTYESVLDLAREGIGEDKFGFRTEFLHLVDLLNN